MELQIVADRYYGLSRFPLTLGISNQSPYQSPIRKIRTHEFQRQEEFFSILWCATFEKLQSKNLWREYLMVEENFTSNTGGDKKYWAKARDRCETEKEREAPFSFRVHERVTTIPEMSVERPTGSYYTRVTNELQRLARRWNFKNTPRCVYSC